MFDFELNDRIWMDQFQIIYSTYINRMHTIDKILYRPLDIDNPKCVDRPENNVCNGWKKKEISSKLKWCYSLKKNKTWKQNENNKRQLVVIICIITDIATTTITITITKYSMFFESAGLYSPSIFSIVYSPMIVMNELQIVQHDFGHSTIYDIRCDKTMYCWNTGKDLKGAWELNVIFKISNFCAHGHGKAFQSVFQIFFSFFVQRDEI